MEWEYTYEGAWQPFSVEENAIINNAHLTEYRVVLWNREIILDLRNGLAALAATPSSVIRIQTRAIAASRAPANFGPTSTADYSQQAGYTASTHTSSSNVYRTEPTNGLNSSYMSQADPAQVGSRPSGTPQHASQYTPSGYGPHSSYASSSSYAAQPTYSQSGYLSYPAIYNDYVPNRSTSTTSTASPSVSPPPAVQGPPKRGTTKPDLPKSSSSTKPLAQRIWFEFVDIRDGKTTSEATMKQLLSELASLSDQKALQVMKDFSMNGDSVMTGKSAFLSTHYVRSSGVLSKEFITQVTITNASDVSLKWQIRDSQSLRQEEFFSCMPNSGELLPGTSSTFEVSVVVYGSLEKPTDDVKWNRLIVVDTMYGQQGARLQHLGMALSINAKYESKTSFWEIPHNYINDGGAIGKGAFASVTRALVKGVVCAKKSWKKRTPDFEAELKVLTKIKHRYIVKMVGVCETKEEVSIILEYCQNGSMTDYCHSNVELDFAWATSFCRKLTSAVKALHDHNWIHRDLKAALDNAKQPAEVAIGSKPWIAPEAFNHKINTKASDIYSLGLVFHELTSRETPPRTFFHIASGLITDLSQHVVSFSPKFAALIVYFCCNPDPQKRPTIDVVEKILSNLEQNPN